MLSTSTQELEHHMQLWNKRIEETNQHILHECKDEFEALKKAQRECQEKIDQVMRSEKMKTLEQSMFEEEEKTNKYVRRMQREYDKIYDDIELNPSLSQDEKRNQLNALAVSARDKFIELNEKYPAAMKAQMLANLSGKLLL